MPRLTVAQIYQKINECPLRLPGRASHLRMHPRRDQAVNELIIPTTVVKAAVMALFYEEDDTLYGLLTERQDYVGNHSGQMSLPGGKSDPSDQSLVETALRETEEETGINKASIKVACGLTEVYINVSNYVVYPFIGFCKMKPLIRVDPREVKQMIHFPIEKILQEDAIVTTKIRISEQVTLKDVPAFILEEKVVWGATALILNEIRDLILVD